MKFSQSLFRLLLGLVQSLQFVISFSGCSFGEHDLSPMGFGWMGSVLLRFDLAGRRGATGVHIRWNERFENMVIVCYFHFILLYNFPTPQFASFELLELLLIVRPHVFFVSRRFGAFHFSNPPKLLFVVPCWIKFHSCFPFQSSGPLPPVGAVVGLSRPS